MSSKVYYTRKITLTAIILLGFLYLAAAFFVFSRQDYDKATKDMEQTMQYVKAQYLEYKKLDTASEAKSLARMMDKVRQVSMKMEHEARPLSHELLYGYATELRLTGIIVLDPAGKLVCEYGNENFSYNSLKNELQRKPVLDVARYSKKLYTKRIVLSDGSYMDIGSHERADAPGIVICYYHTPADYIENYNLSLQTLMSAYNPDNNGTIVISDGYKVLASNDETLLGSLIEKNKLVANIRENAKRGELLKLKGTDGKIYYGSLDRGRDFYTYIFLPESQVYATRWAKTGEALLFYLLIVSAFFFVLRKSEQEHLRRQQELDEKYKQELIKSAWEAERANNAKTEFLQRMSHDIRTPINGIRGMLEIAGLNINDGKKVNECLTKIGESSAYLLDLVSEILDMGKLNSGEIALESVPFDIRKLCDEVTTMMSKQAVEKNIEISTTRDENIPRYLIGSPLHVKRILTNVLNNAVKYNKLNGKVFLSIKELERKDDFITLEFTCEDSGIGISEKFLPHIFEAFTQDVEAARSEYEGGGLGMPIVKSLVEKMGGTITVNSKQGEGSKFVITLSFQIYQSTFKDAEQTKFDVSALKNMHVLLAEDNELNMEIAQYFLEKAEITYTAVKNGKEAVEAFSASAEHEYDVVLMDIMMPVMDGLEATRQIRSLDRKDAKSVPIIAMTANAFIEDKQKAFDAGMTEHVTKPLQSDVLLEVIAAHTKKA